MYLFNKIAEPHPANLLENRFLQRCFSSNFAKFLRTPILKKPLGNCFYKRFSSNSVFC